MPKIVDHEEYRKELLSKSFEVFAQRGYSSLTIRDLASSLGVSTGTLYHYFPSKLDLFEQLLIHIAERDIVEITGMLSKLKSLDEKVDVLFDYLERFESEYQKQVLVMIDALRELGAERAGKISAFERADRIYMTAMCKLLNLDEEASMFLGCAINGLLIERMINPSLFSIQGQKKFIVQFLKANTKKA